MNISRAAQLAGVNVETIRYYQRRGLIAVPVKTVGFHRRYSQNIVDRIRFIKRTQSWGFSLDEIEQLLQPGQQVRSAQVQQLVQTKIHTLQIQRQELDRVVSGLKCLLKQCAGQAGCEGCSLRGHVLCPSVDVS